MSLIVGDEIVEGEKERRRKGEKERRREGENLKERKRRIRSANIQVDS